MDFCTEFIVPNKSEKDVQARQCLERLNSLEQKKNETYMTLKDARGIVESNKTFPFVSLVVDIAEMLLCRTINT